MWFNPIVKLVLRSPLHRLASKNTLLITFRGRKSGKTYTLPVSFVRSGEELLIVSFRHRTWWRNLRGSVPVTVWIEGKKHPGVAHAIDDNPAEIAAALGAYLQKDPFLARHLGVDSDDKGQLNAGQVARAAEKRVMVSIQIER